MTYRRASTLSGQSAPTSLQGPRELLIPLAIAITITTIAPAGLLTAILGAFLVS